MKGMKGGEGVPFSFIPLTPFIPFIPYVTVIVPIMNWCGPQR